MKKVLEAASDMIVPGIIFAAIVASLTAGALLTKTGQRMEAEKQDFSNSADTEAVERICEREAPTITCVGKRTWGTGETIDTGSLFLAEDAEGRALDVRTVDITDASGNSAMDRYHEPSRTARFTDSGIYTFHLRAMDSERKTSEAMIPLAVDSR